MGRGATGILIGAALALLTVSTAKAADQVVARITPSGGDTLVEYPVVTVVRQGDQTLVRLSDGNLVTDLPGEAAWRRLQTLEGWNAAPPAKPTPPPGSAPLPVMLIVCDGPSVRVDLAVPGRPAESRNAVEICGFDATWEFASALIRAAVAADPACARLPDKGHAFDLAQRCLMLQDVREAAMEVATLRAALRACAVSQLASSLPNLAARRVEERQQCAADPAMATVDPSIGTRPLAPERLRLYRGLSATWVEVAWTADGQATKQLWTKGADGRWSIEQTSATPAPPTPPRILDRPNPWGVPAITPSRN